MSERRVAVHPRRPVEEDQAAAAAREASTLFERAPCGFVLTSPDGVIGRVNQTFERWTGHRGSALVGQTRFADLLSVGGRIYYETHLAPLLRMQGSAREIALELVRADGQRLPVLANLELDSGHGRPDTVQIALMDATERRQYERELMLEKTRAEESERRARELARTLQRTLIPPTPAEIPGLDVAAVYRPAGLGDEVGGDFYDVFQVGPGDWIVALGDICGKGVEAAVVSSFVRFTLRASAARLLDPAEILAELNRALLVHESERFATVLVVRLTRSGDAWEVTTGIGGHPLPVLRPAEGPARTFGTPGTLIGAFEGPDLVDSRSRLGPGDSIVLYTDGVTEGRRGRTMYGDERLLRLLDLHRDSAAETAQGLLDDVLDFQDGRPRDDIAVVALRGTS
ncbi:PP2C family protein-serine/threonine phosphatase [Nocardioides donggukensis]|uniref:SpoIIE family protein phosphatase n=1 Tax=Nocardioides donggukensis TaxID=2774019 RepID=A0A927Q2T9_9ACTN|nr:SpoIIE family protein phosphatase [Nocardioides donggukensis]MBD8870704.1 SpoIIE family protein phosphatase [Nocardioides donggukensis]